jgi:predicted acyl esterase
MIYLSSGKQLVYHSAPFDQDTEISGFFKLAAWLSINQPDTDFRATIYEVALDGSSIRLSADWVRARYRKDLREEALVSTQEPLRYDFERFTSTSRLVKRGNRLRLVIGPMNSIYSQKNYNSGRPVSEESAEDARPVIVKLFHDEPHPSALYVPLGQPQR